MNKSLLLTLFGVFFFVLCSLGQDIPDFKSDAEKEKWVKENPESYQKVIQSMQKTSKEGEEIESNNEIKSSQPIQKSSNEADPLMNNSLQNEELENKKNKNTIKNKK